MLKKAKEIVVSADSRTKGILAVACIYFAVTFATVTTGAVNQIIDFIPTIDIKLRDGVQEEKDYLVKKDTVTNVLTELNLELNKGDTLNKDKDYVVQQNDLLEITRVETKTVIKEEPLPYSTVTKGSGGWSTTIEQDGKDGKVKRTYLISYANGEETSKKVIKEEILVEPIDKVIKKGGVSEGTTFTGRLTTYGGDCNGCGGGSSAGASLSPTTGVNGSNSPFLSYNGNKYYALAADRSIPFGTVIKISNHNLNLSNTIYGIVVDRGGAIKGNKIDIFKGSERGGTSYFGGGTSNNTKFEIVSMGSGRARFWR